MQIDPYILAFSAITVFATIWMGFRSARTSKTASDFFVAGRSVGVGMNASAISGEYLSAASFMGVAGMVMSVGYDALWYPVCYACGYLFLLLFIAGPLRRFGAYTVPDLAEGRFDSPVFRKIAVVFVLFIGFFYTMPQMKGAGTTLAYIFPGLPYWAGVVLVGAVITLNVALGGMKGITLVQAFQYWIKMFAISVPVFVLMAVYEGYGKHLEQNSGVTGKLSVNSSVELEAKFGPRRFRIIERPGLHMSLAALLSNLNSENIQGFAKQKLGLNTAIKGQEETASLETLLAYVSIFNDGATVYTETNLNFTQLFPFALNQFRTEQQVSRAIRSSLASAKCMIYRLNQTEYACLSDATALPLIIQKTGEDGAFRKPLPEKAPADATWLNPFGPLTTKAAKAAAATLSTNRVEFSEMPLRTSATNLSYRFRFSVLGKCELKRALERYSVFVDRTLVQFQDNYVPSLVVDFGSDVVPILEAKKRIENIFSTNGMTVVPVGENLFRSIKTADLDSYRESVGLMSRAEWLGKYERPYSLLYTYSLIIAIVCGTAGLPHILVRFYTNPDGVAAKRTTMWVMILIGVFYVFPPVFGVMGRNLLPELYDGVGAKGTDKIVLELPRILNQKSMRDSREGGEGSEVSKTQPASPATSPPSQTSRDTGIPWGSILSGVTCAGAFAAFMSTFSGLLVSMTGAMAHDVYGRMLNPKATPTQRLRAFKVAAVIVGGVAILLGMQVETLDINFMVSQAFAIAAASYFPFLFMCAWWRKLTMKGAATNMLSGGLLALAGITLTSISDIALKTSLAKGTANPLQNLQDFWAGHPALRIICEQPAIWAVPLAILLMIIVSKLTSKEVPKDIRMKMLVLHAPEKLGIKQEYIQEHQHGH